MVQSTGDSRKKITKKDEILFACEEVLCNSKCLKKASPKCSKSENCMKERGKICKKRCRRSRCEARCKDEPQLGYVEREMKIDKCKEACQTEKCKTKCDEEFQSCKSKCFSKAHKFICPDLPAEPTTGNGDEKSNDDSKSSSDDEGSDSSLDFADSEESSSSSSLDFGGASASEDFNGDSSNNIDFTVDDSSIAGGNNDDDEPL